MQNFILVKTERDNVNIKRVLRVDPLERMFRKCQIDADLYRVGRCLEDDLQAMGAVGGGNALQRCGEAFVPLTGGGGRNVNDAALEAAQRVYAASDAVGAVVMFAMLIELVRDGYSTTELMRRWKLRYSDCCGSVVEALKRVHGENVYVDRRHKVQIWAAA